MMLGQTVKNLSRYLSRWRESAIYGLLLAVLLLNPAFAQNVSTVAIAAVDSVAKLPGAFLRVARFLLCLSFIALQQLPLMAARTVQAYSLSRQLLGRYRVSLVVAKVLAVI